MVGHVPICLLVHVSSMSLMKVSLAGQTLTQRENYAYIHSPFPKTSPPARGRGSGTLVDFLGILNISNQHVTTVEPPNNESIGIANFIMRGFSLLGEFIIGGFTVSCISDKYVRTCEIQQMSMYEYDLWSMMRHMGQLCKLYWPRACPISFYTPNYSSLIS